MFDCVWPCRTARFGTVIVPSGLVNLKKSKYATDMDPLDKDCTCYVCKNYTRSYLTTVAGKEEVGCSLLTIHNIHYMIPLMKEIRQAITEERYPQYISDFLHRHFPKKNYPKWVYDTLNACDFGE